MKYPSAFKKKGVKLHQLKVDYYQSAKGLMTVVIFGRWLKTWNEKPARQCHHILFLVDNAPSHMIDAQYSNIKCVPAHQHDSQTTTPQSRYNQSGYKLSYHKAITKKVLACIDVEKPDDFKDIINSLDFVEACKNIMAAWNHISEALIIKCFQKADFIDSVPNCPEPELAPDHILWDNIQRALQINILFEQYATADDTIQTSEDLTEADIIKRVHAVTNGSNEYGKDPDGLEEDDDDAAVMVTGTAIADESEIIHNSDQFLHWIAQQKAYIIQNNLPDRATEILQNFNKW